MLPRQQGIPVAEADQVEVWLLSAGWRRPCSEWKKGNTGMLEDGRTICYRMRMDYTSLLVMCMDTAQMIPWPTLNSAVAALGNRKIFTLGDWNFEPDELPMDLVQGSQVNPPLSDVEFTSPTRKVKLDWLQSNGAGLWT
eukprot:4135785-Amphidinium_carterae.2